MSFKRPSATFGAPHGSYAPFKIDAPEGITYSKGLKITPL